jgi:nucleoside-diphosphate-sugar epimerase
MSNLLVTGSAGFIGWKTCQYLLKGGHSVFGVDNLNDYYDVKLKEYRLSQLQSFDGFGFQVLNIENLEALDDLFSSRKIDAVINLAARAGVRYSTINPHVYVSTNSQGTLNLLETMKKYGVKKFVLASTSSLYAGQPMPFVESLSVNTPISPYAASKKAAELMAYTYHYLFDIDVTVLRYFTVYGPAGRPDMSVFRFIKWINEGEPIELFGDGSQARDFTYVDDIADGTVRALKKLGYEIINLGGGRNPYTINNVIELIEKPLGKKAKINRKPLPKEDIKVTEADITKAGKLLDWSPKIDLEEGLQRSVEWYLQNRNWLKDIDV